MSVTTPFLSKSSFLQSALSCWLASGINDNIFGKQTLVRGALPGVRHMAARARSIGIPVIDESEAEAKTSAYENSIIISKEKGVACQKQ